MELQAGRPMRVLFLSRWRVNPYQKLLVQGLEARGFVVEEEAPAVPRLHRNVDVVHLQNIRRFLTANGIAVAFLRCVAFAVQLAVARIRGIRVVWTIHDLENPIRRHPRLDRVVTFLLFRVSHAVIVHSEEARKAVTQEARVRKHVKVRYVGHGHYAEYYDNRVSRTEARTKLGLEGEHFVLLFFGWVSRYKGVVDLVRAIREIPEHRLRLVVAGAVSDAAYGEELKAAAAGDDRIRFHLGTVPEAEVQVFMNASDAVVFPYERVLTSGALVLAKSFGKACIVAEEAGLAVAGDRDGVITYDRKTEEGLRTALITAMTKAGELRSMGEYNRRSALACSWRDVGDATATIYRELVGERPRPEEIADSGPQGL